MRVYDFSSFYMWLFATQFENDGTWKDERKHHGAVEKSSSNNRSMLRTANAFVMLKIGPICLALVGLMAGWQAISPADKIVVVLEIFKIQ